MRGKVLTMLLADTQISHNPQVSMMLPVGNIPYNIVDETAGI